MTAATTARSVEHATFAVERVFAATPARVFAAWADPALKARWFGPPEGWETSGVELDFRVGGHERTSDGPPGGPVYAYHAVYHDIVPDQRIVYAYEMHQDAARISVSLGTVEFAPEGDGCRLTYTEQGAYLDGLDTPDQRREGTAGIFDALAAVLERDRDGGGGGG